MHGIHFSSQWSHDERKNDGWPSAINFREQESDQNFHIFLEHQQRGRMNNTTAFENHGMNAQSFLNTSQYQSPPDRNWDFQRDKNSRYFSNEIPIMNFRQGDSNTARFEENSRAIDKSRYHPSPHGYQGNTFQNGNDFNIRNASQYLVQNNPPSKSSSYKINIIEQSEQPKLKENDEKSLENNQKVIKKMSRVERRYAESAADPHPDFVYVVQFKRDFRGYTPHKNSAQLQYHVGDVVLTNTHQGDDIGIVTDILSVAELAERRRVADLRTAALGCEPKEETYIGHILSVATTAQRKQQAQLRLEEQEVMKNVQNLAVTVYNATNMRVLDAEYQFDRAKLSVYYTSAERVDFRVMVRELTAMYGTRVWVQCVGTSLAASIPIRYAVVDSDDEQEEEQEEQEAEEQVTAV